LPEEREEKDAIGVRRAAQRRLEIELGIPHYQAPPANMHYITRIHYKDKGDGIWGEHEIDYIIFLKGDVDVKPNANEVSEVRYVAFDEFDKFLQDLKDPLTPWFSLISNNHLRFWWSNLHRFEHFCDHEKIFRFQESPN